MLLNLIGPARKAILGEGYRESYKENRVKERERAGLPALSAAELEDAAWAAWEKYARRHPEVAAGWEWTPVVLLGFLAVFAVLLFSCTGRGG